MCPQTGNVSGRQSCVRGRISELRFHIACGRPPVTVHRLSFDAPYRTVITALPDGPLLPSGRSDFDAMPSPTPSNLSTQVMSVWIADVKFVLDRLRKLNGE